jgi:ABC-2 type transport system ATP-binding protein
MECAIACRHMKKSYGSFALDLEDFTVATGTVHGLIGANGCGKTTTIKLLLGLLSPDSGELSVLGSNRIGLDAETRQHIGFIVDDASVPGLLNANELAAVLKRCYHNWDQEQYEGYLKQFEIDPKKQYRKYSRGMKVKLQLAVALSHHASLLILDEPTSGLDPLARDEIITILSEFSRDENHTILISSHITSDLEKLCDYVTFLEEGGIRFTEEKDELLETYRLGIVSHQMVADIDSDSIIAKREGSFQVELLLKTENVPSFLESRRLSLEELIIFLSKGRSAV